MKENRFFFNFSNAWPPMQHLVITALMKSGDKSAQIVAKNLVRKWVKSNYVSYMETNGTMFEKYDANKVIFLQLQLLDSYKLIN